MERFSDGETALPEGHVAGAPLESYLGGREATAFVLSSKRGSVTVEREGETATYSSARGYRVVVLVTDIRVLIAVGGADGGDDRVVSVPLATVKRVDSESGRLLGGSLTVETTGGEQWTVPCRGDLDPVVAFLDSGRRAWSHGVRLVDNADERIEAAATSLETGDPDAALSALEEAESVIDRGVDHLEEFDIGPAVADNAGLTRRRRRIRRLRRRAFARRGDRANERAQRRWEQADYGATADAMRAAKAAYVDALAVDAPRPSDEDLDERIAALEWRMADLKRTPLAEATAALAGARETVDPLWRAPRSAEALAQYRDLLGLSWGPDASFKGDSDEIRDQVTEIVAEIVPARVDLSRRALAAADRFAARGRTEAALSACDAADAHLDRARSVAAELAPDRVAAIEARRAVVADQRERCAGSATDPGAVAGAAVDSATDPGVDVDTTGGGERASPGETAPPERETDTPESGPTAVAAESEDAGADAEDGMEARFRALDNGAFTRLVANVWETLGWETSAFTAAVEQYDVIATQERPLSLRVLIWTVHSPEDPIGTATVDRCAADRAGIEHADAAALVTTGAVPEAVRERADEHNVKLLDRADLVALLDREELAHLLDRVDPGTDGT